jgi:hypothetical protein
MTTNYSSPLNEEEENPEKKVLIAPFLKQFFFVQT